ncbi:MAG TPA: hypothetical protein VIA06_12985, partial [Candidatus Dormibacteraeota bacterium]|nr:hypothetical protein [Candidatus Dormibacteraeota bacterium]
AAPTPDHLRQALTSHRLGSVVLDDEDNSGSNGTQGLLHSRGLTGVIIIDDVTMAAPSTTIRRSTPPS